MRAALVLLLLASEGCASFAFSRFSPQQSERTSPSACPDWPPAVDLISGLILGIGGLTLQGLNSAVAECGNHSSDPNCHVHVAYFVPVMIAAASVTYGAAAYAVCEHRRANDWRPRVEDARAQNKSP
jgi:hypothetical protein